MSHSDFAMPARPEPCTYEGKLKAVGQDGHVSVLLCQAHAEHWKKCFPNSRIVEPRNFTGERYPCRGDWVLPGEIP